MARPESQALAGYFPTPSHLLSSLSCLVSLPPMRYGQQVLFDPCAGTGEAIAGLRRSWFGEEAAKHSKVVAIEMERERFEELCKSRFQGDTMLCSDAFLCHRDGYAGEGASLLFLNPPYDHDPDYRRLEQRFLAYATPLLGGGGALLFVVPVYALKASASYLSRHYTEIRAFRFPPGDYEVFRQCVVVASRREHPVLKDEVTERRILAWASDGESLPVLGASEVEPLEVKVDSPSLRLQRAEVGIFELVDGFRPWEGSEVGGVHHDVASLIGGKFEVALPPMPAHIALALSAGMLNGKRLAADDPMRFPPLLVKATFSAQPVVVQEKRDKKGKVTGQVEVEQPKLEITVLRLNEGTFHPLAPGTVPSGATEVARFNSADLLEHYGQGLLRLLREQFPALHDPTEPAHAIELPRLARKPFRAQAKLIQAALKLLARGDNPEILAEVGTGKTTIALYVAAALSPAHIERTRAELERVGLPGERLDPVRRVLVVCPPHLLKSWADQAAAVVPEARVQVLEKLSDLDDGDEEGDFEIFVLSRETAKLGHAVEGVKGPCPRCGSPVEATPEERASKRLRCDAEERRPLDEVARLALRLAGILAPSFPQDPRIRSLLDGHRILARSMRRREVPAPFPGASALAPICEKLLARVLRHYEKVAGCSYSHRLTAELEALVILGRLCGFEESCAAKLEALLPERTVSEWGIRAEVRKAADELRAGEAAEPEENLDALAKLEAAGRWGISAPCGEPLFGAVPRPRRYPLARFIVKRAKRGFDLAVIDEAHEYRNLGSAQQKAAHRLVGLPGVPTLTLTGSAMSGYASSLFAHKWAVSAAFRAEYGHGERARFAREYGYRKLLRKTGDSKEQRRIKSFGAQSDREEGAGSQELRQIGEAPGVAPLFILKHVLPTGLLMHKADLDDALPPLTERSLPIVLDRESDPQAGELKAETGRLVRTLLEQIKKDRFSEMAGRLFGALSKLRSYPDLAASECGPFSLCYPEVVGGAEVARGKAFPDDWISPKEAWMLEQVERQVGRGRKVMVFLLHTGNVGFVARIRRLVAGAAGEEPVFLDASRVSAGKREEWLNKKVVKPGKKVLIVQPVAVQTGLNNLTGFSTAIWYEGVHQDALVVRQANGRLHRPGQTLPVEIFYPHYQGTLQETAHDLVARKIAASMQVDGLSLETALETAGAGAVDREAALAAMAFGEALFNAWKER